MPDDHPTTPDPHAPPKDDHHADVDALCSRFERAWPTGKRQSIEECLEVLDEVSREAALTELVLVELELRRKAGEEPTEREYVRRFPEHSALVGNLFHQTAPLVGQTPRQGNPRGLHVRCPNCHVPIELVVDAEMESIDCPSCGSNFSLTSEATSTRHAEGITEVGHFRLVERLGIGGFGTIWKAQDTALDRTVAVKIPRRGQLEPHEEEQFLKEARSAAQLNHPHIVSVHEVGRDRDTIYIVSDFVRGVSLSDWIEKQRLTVREAAQLCVKLADALHHAHESGVIHRDFKPQNVIIDGRGEPHLTDFGLARRETGEITMTVDGQILGTPAYMSPEQAMGESHTADRRTDVYSLGVLLFQLLTGELPFRGNARMMIHQVVNDEPPNPKKLNANVPRDLETICLKAMEKDSVRRYVTAAAMREDLERYLRGEPIAARPIGRVERAVRWARRKPMAAATVGLIILLAIGGPIVAVGIDRQRKDLAALVEEKNNLIEQSAQEKTSDANRIAKLQNELDVWLGRTNPWAYWPPQPDLPPYLATLESIATIATTRLDALLANGHLAAQQQVYAHLALGLMADRRQRNPAALSHYQSAAKLLAKLKETAKNKPEKSQFNLALADCHLQMSRITAGDVETSRRHLNDARQILKELNENLPVDPKISAALMDAELRRVVSTGFENSADSLDRAEDVSRRLRHQLPNDPRQLYEFVCFLTHRDAVVLNTTSPPAN